MTLQTGIFKTENRFEAFMLAFLSLILSILSIFIFMQFLGILGLNYDASIILEHTVLSVFDSANLKANLGLMVILSLFSIIFLIAKNSISNLVGYFGIIIISSLLSLIWLYSFFLILDLKNFALILFWATPLVLTGLAVAVAFRGGLFNIGGQGQMIMGGVFAGIWAAVIVPTTPALKFLDTPFLMIPSTLIVSIIFGAIWGGIPGFLRAYTGAHEVITTILMNQIAFNFASLLVGSSDSPFVQKGGDKYGQTDEIVKSAQILPIFPEFSSSLNWSIFIVLIVVLIIHYIIWKSNLGFKIRATGYNKTAAEVSGINTKRTILTTMLISGAVAGLAGGIYVMSAMPYRYIYGREGTIGFDGIAVSLIGFNNPIPIIFAALLFGILRQGRFNLDLKTNISSDLIVNLQALVILFTAAPLLSAKLYNNVLRLPIIIGKGEDTLKHKLNDLKNWISYNKQGIFIGIMILGLPLVGHFIFNMLEIDFFAIFSILDPLFEIGSDLTILLALLTMALILFILIKFIIGIKEKNNNLGTNLPVVAIALLLITGIYISVKFYLMFVSIVFIVFKMVKFIMKFTERNKQLGNSVYLIILKLFGLFIFLINGLIAFLYVLVMLSFGFVDPFEYYNSVAEVLFSSFVIKNMLIASFPIMMAAIGGTINERAGIINIGLEGILLMSAFGGALFAIITGNPFAGLIGGIFLGTLLSFIHAFFTISLKAEHIVTGVGINLLALGLTDLLTSFLWGGSSSITIENKLPKLSLLPIIWVFDIPVFGDLFRVLSLQSILLFIGILLIPLIHILLFKTPFGLRLRVIGEEPNAAATAGIPVKRYQYIAVMLSGAITSIGGVFLSIGDSNVFQSNMTGGRGFTALAAMIFGKWTVIGSTLTSLFFGYFYAIAIGLKSIPGDYFKNIFEILTMLPFIIAILVLAGAIGLARPPKSIGKSYDPQD